MAKRENCGWTLQLLKTQTLWWHLSPNTQFYSYIMWLAWITKSQAFSSLGVILPFTPFCWVAFKHTVRTPMYCWNKFTLSAWKPRFLSKGLKPLVLFYDSYLRRKRRRKPSHLDSVCLSQQTFTRNTQAFPSYIAEFQAQIHKEHSSTLHLKINDNGTLDLASSSWGQGGHSGTLAFHFPNVTIIFPHKREQGL